MNQQGRDPIRLLIDQLSLSRLDEQIEQTFDSLLTAPWLTASGAWTPHVDVFETPDAVLIEADLPGVALDQFDVAVDDDEVTLSGHRSSNQTRTTPRGVVLVERRHGSFRRTFQLSSVVDADNITIEHEKGVFRILLPKEPRQEQS